MDLNYMMLTIGCGHCTLHESDGQTNLLGGNGSKQIYHDYAPFARADVSYSNTLVIPVGA